MRLSSTLVLAATLLLSAAASPDEIRFSSPTTHAVGDFPTGIAVGDLDGDGFADIATANSISGDVSVLLALGGANFGPEVRLSGSGGDVRDVAIAELDGDGVLDIVFAERFGTAGIGVYLGNGDGSFQSGRFVGLPEGYTALELADVDGDGDLDVVLATIALSVTAVELHVFSNDAGSFSMTARYPVVVPAQFAYNLDLASGDVNGDGSTDFVIAGQFVVGFMALLEGRPDGTFVQGIVPPLSPNPLAVALGDVDRDGDLDLAVVDNGGAARLRLRLARNDGAGTFAPAESYTIGSPVSFEEAQRALQVGDLNRDGRPDIVTSGGVARGAQNGFVVERAGLGFGLDAELVDLDGDRDLDLVMSRRSTGSSGVVDVYVNRNPVAARRRPASQAVPQ